MTKGPNKKSLIQELESIYVEECIEDKEIVHSDRAFGYLECLSSFVGVSLSEEINAEASSRADKYLRGLE